jgi:hypothetical protein
MLYAGKLGRGGPISKYIIVWKEEKYGRGSGWGPIPRATVLATTSCNLLDLTGLE